MQNIVIGLALKWIVSQLAEGGATVDWAGLKTKAHVAVAQAIPSKYLDGLLDAVADQVVDAAARMLQNQAEILALLQALAGKNLGQAEAALKALLTPYLPADLAAAL